MGLDPGGARPRGAWGARSAGGLVVPRALGRTGRRVCDALCPGSGTPGGRVGPGTDLQREKGERGTRGHKTREKTAAYRGENGAGFAWRAPLAEVLQAAE